MKFLTGTRPAVYLLDLFLNTSTALSGLSCSEEELYSPNPILWRLKHAYVGLSFTPQLSAKQVDRVSSNHISQRKQFSTTLAANRRQCFLGG
ncbi:hypothetical protein T265_14660, partial [Opisthorchis viverrini]